MMAPTELKDVDMTNDIDSNSGHSGQQNEERASRIAPMPEGVLAPFAQQMSSSGGANMSTLFRVMGHRPEIMGSAIELLEATMRGGTVEPQLKELVAVRVSQVNHCSY